MPTQDPIQTLFIADPELGKTVQTTLNKKSAPVSFHDKALLVDETMWGLSQEISFGYAVAKNYAELLGETRPDQIRRYRQLIREAGENGPALGQIMATALVPVIRYGKNGFLEQFLHTVNIMRKKGTYTLKPPLESLSLLLNGGDTESGRVYLALLRDTFSQKLTYNQSLRLSHDLPKAVLCFSRAKRIWQTRQFSRVIRADICLADFFLEGMGKGLHLLTEDALEQFVSLGLEKFHHSENLGRKFFSLESKLGLDAYAEQVVSVSFSQVQHRLNRYLHARLDIPLSVAETPSQQTTYSQPAVCSDGKHIYLPDEISKFDQKAENLNLYKCLTKLESAYYEFGTFDFDLEKVMHRPGIRKIRPGKWDHDPRTMNSLSDMECFFHLYPVKSLAADLFNILEQGRIRRMLNRFYPGIIRQYASMLEQEAVRIYEEDETNEVLFLLYAYIALGVSTEESFGISDETRWQAANVAASFDRMMDEDDSVEACAELVMRFYDAMESLIQNTSGNEMPEHDHIPLKPPFGRKLRPDLFFSAHQDIERLAETVKTGLEEKGLKAYKSDIRKHLMKNKGKISIEDIKEIVTCGTRNAKCEMQGMTISDEALRELFGHSDMPHDILNADAVSWYKEWDQHLRDYLYDHVRVLDRVVPGAGSDVYNAVLARHQGLVRQIRHAFEILRPEGLTLLRQWKEGDEFDYRALLDFAMDKKAGIMPSDRLYIKRIKQERDVAVLLLVDLSRSTSNLVPGTASSVLDIEKEAIVLFCEAIEVVGDAFAIAGFSGTGRLGVDYFRIKDFDQIMDDVVRQRISAMSPQRSTRMGAAIRHGTCQLEKVAANVRLLIILGDGFPNDTGYKREYAVADTRRAIFEARSKNIHTRAITVNLVGDSELDGLYGSLHHNVISDVRELPGKLLRIYSTLTR